MRKKDESGSLSHSSFLPEQRNKREKPPSLLIKCSQTSALLTLLTLPQSPKAKEVLKLIKIIKLRMGVELEADVYYL